MRDVTICFGLLFHFFEVALRSWQWGTLQSCFHAVRRVGRERNREASCGSAVLLLSTWKSSISEYQHLHRRIIVPQCIKGEILDGSPHIVICSPQGKNVFALIFWQPKQICCKRTVCRLFRFNRARAANEIYIISSCLQKYNFGVWCNPGFPHELQRQQQISKISPLVYPQIGGLLLAKELEASTNQDKIKKQEVHQELLTVHWDAALIWICFWVMKGLDTHCSGRPRYVALPGTFNLSFEC